MNDFHPIDWLFLVAYMVITLGASLWAAVGVKSIRDFTVAGRQMPMAAVFATLAASFIGGGYAMGFTAKGFQVGFIFFPVLMGFAVKTVFEGLVVAPRIRRYENAVTVGDVMGFHYGLQARLLTGVLSMLFCAGIVGVVSRAAGGMLQSFTGLPLVYGATLCAIAVIVYSAFGGMLSSVISDCIQFVVLAIFIPLIPVLMIMGVGVDESLSQAANEQLSKPAWGTMAPMAMGGAFLAFLLGETLVPPYAQRCFIGKSDRGTSVGFVLAAAFFVFWSFVLLAIGVISRPIVPAGVTPDDVLVTTIIKATPMGVTGLCCAAILSIIMSTQDSFLNSAATSFVYDIYAKCVSGDAHERTALLVGRFSTILIGVLGVGFAIITPSLIEGLLVLYDMWAPTVVLPLVMAVIGVRTKPAAGVAAIICGAAATALFRFGLGEPGGVPALIPGLLANQLAFWFFQMMPDSVSAKLGIVAESQQKECRVVLRSSS